MGNGPMMGGGYTGSSPMRPSTAPMASTATPTAGGGISPQMQQYLQYLSQALPALQNAQRAGITPNYSALQGAAAFGVPQGGAGGRAGMMSGGGMQGPGGGGDPAAAFLMSPQGQQIMAMLRMRGGMPMATGGGMPMATGGGAQGPVGPGGAVTPYYGGGG